MARITSGRCPASPLATNAGGAAPANARSCRPAATIRICRGQARPCSDRLPAVEGPQITTTAPAEMGIRADRRHFLIGQLGGR